ncbi:MAG: response regulator [candidate division WOR-3 bacterium]|nr:response regulator [candidate division WOR-3 bacterium]
MKPELTKILIIDDEPAICDACYQILTEKNYSVEIASNGSEGLKKFEDFNPDVVFIDLKMPGISGIDVLKTIVEKKKNTIPIVITGYASIETAVESMKNGAFDFLPKPFTADELIVITARAVAKKRDLDVKEKVNIEKEMMRQNFISLVSHELRTPLVAVMQYLEVLYGGMAGQISEQQRQIIERMKIRLNELLDLINRWLKLARLEELNIKENFQEFSLEQLIDESVELIKPLAFEKRINIEKKSINEDYKVFGEKDLLKEVFVNLITNGVKYNQEKGSVYINCRKDGDYIAVDITDTGIGISDDDIKRLGEEFYRVKREGVVSGSGLGLAIVKKILDIHNGRLEIKSKLNEGSTFTVYLPLVACENRQGEKRSEK